MPMFLHLRQNPYENFTATFLQLQPTWFLIQHEAAAIAYQVFL
jgi:hypothetical protein